MNEDSKPTFDSESDELSAECDFSHATRRNQKRFTSEPTVRIESASGVREAKIKTVEVCAIVTEEGSLTIQLPSDITPGEHRIVLLIEESI